MPNYTGHSSLSGEHIKCLENELHLKVNVTFISWSKALREIYASFKNANPPDVFQIGTTWVTTMAHMGYLEQVPESFEHNKVLADWIADISYYNGKKMAVPWLVESGMLIARKDIMKTLGITGKDIRTIEGFKDVCGRIYDSHVKSKNSIPLPFAFSLRTEIGKLHHLIPWFWASGFQIPDLFNMPETPFSIENLEPAFNYFKSLFITCHHSQEDASEHRYIINDRFYQNGKYTFTIDHWYNIVLGVVNESKMTDSNDNPFEIFEMPSGFYGPTPKGNGSLLGVSSTSKHKKEAWRVVQYLLSDTYMDQRIKLCGDTPSLESDFWKIHTRHPHIELMRRQIGHAKTYPKHPLWASFERLMNEELTKLLWHYIFKDKSLNDMSSIIGSMNKKFRELSSLAWELKKNEG
jgi:ABC-type glycerol-3-phosphate transport system substrate-binding protein